MGLFGKKKKGIMALEGQEFIDAYNKQLEETGKATLAEKARFVKETAKIRNKMIQSGGM